LREMVEGRRAVDTPGRHQPRFSRGEPAPRGRSDWVQRAVRAPDVLLASGAADDTIRLWDLTTGAERAASRGSSGLFGGPTD
jgi:hypothetical protein